MVCPSFSLGASDSYLTFKGGSKFGVRSLLPPYTSAVSTGMLETMPSFVAHGTSTQRSSGLPFSTELDVYSTGVARDPIGSSNPLPLDISVTSFASGRLPVTLPDNQSVSMVDTHAFLPTR